MGLEYSFRDLVHSYHGGEHGITETDMGAESSTSDLQVAGREPATWPGVGLETSKTPPPK